MEREILFRGKSQFTDHEWLYGSLLVLNRKFYVCPNQANKWNMTMFQVIEETIGQFTGLLDKNGKKIFEGDILRFYDNEEDELVNGRVVYSTDFCSFFVCEDDGNNLTLSRVWQYEIIGNIHENKEE